ncbi:MAG TPA: CsgG/HfaB family protein [Candidatus Angelobacter sp.]|nr:CsgG/HfaB family protein [Candidatus Angelobacter sp.]
MPARTSVSWKFTTRLLIALLLCSTLLTAAKQKPLTNDDIIKMAKAGLDEDVMIGTMQANANAFDVSPDALITLKKAGVNAKVLHAMQSLAKSEKATDPAPVAISASPAKDSTKKETTKKKENGDRPGKASNESLTNWKGPLMRLAVMDLAGSALKMQTATQASVSTTTVAIPPPADFARGLTEMLTTALAKTERFVVLERAALDKVTAEQDLGASGRVNPEFAPQLGKLTGAQALITGDITRFSYTQSSVGGSGSFLRGLGAKVEKLNAQVGIDLRIIDAETGEVLLSQSADGNASMSNVSATVTRGGQDFTSSMAENTPLGKATRQALEKIISAVTKTMKSQRWSGRVMDVRGDHIYINAGTRLGLVSAVELDVFRPEPGLTDPETGRRIGTPDRLVGSVVIDAVKEQYSVAKILDGKAFKRGDVVRLKGQQEEP